MIAALFVEMDGCYFAPGEDGTCDHFKPISIAAIPRWKSDFKSAHPATDARANTDTGEDAA